MTDDVKDRTNWEQVEEATELLQELRYHDALLALRDVLRGNPENPYAYHWLGTAFFELGRREEARDAYRAAVRLAPDYLGARVSLSHVLRLLGDAKGALAAANEALRRFPKDGEAQHAAGLAHAARGSRAEARKHLHGFLETSPELEAANEVRQILEMLGLGEEGDPVDFE
jgi:Flp pilus assembly protein TadD